MTPTAAERAPGLRIGGQRIACTPDTAGRSTVIALWLVLNLGLNFYNKWAFTPVDDEHPDNVGPGFTFPIFYTMFCMAASNLGASLVMVFVPSTRTISRQQAWEYKWRLVALSLIYVFNILSQNASLVYISLSVNQVLKCCVPLPTILCAYLIQKTRYPWPIIVATFCVVVGAMLSIPFKDPNVTTYGLVLTFTSIVLAGLRPVVSSILLVGAKESGLSPIPLLWYDSLISVFALLIMFVLSEEMPNLGPYYREHTADGLLIIAGGSAMAFVFNVVSFYLIKQIGPLASTVLGNFKTILLVGLAAIFMDSSTHYKPYNYFGYVMFFVSLFTYSYLNYLHGQKRLRSPWLPCCTRGEGGGGAAAVQPAKEAPPTESTKLVGSK